ncbi:DUF6344 domain-containing protein [Streptomyces sp. NPDC050516]|uniref:DUF6344 domain-containing protein n=1 Tax=Streptomyces sp. NPDC050516 TaxID=3365621 RepID=UPI003798A300
MATSKLTTWWTALIGALVALLASLGLAGQATAAPAASVPQHSATYNRSEPGIPVAPAVHWAVPAASALPPTMKQRIRAEAHGASPSSRHRADDRDSADDPSYDPSTPGGDTGVEAPDSPSAPGGDTAAQAPDDSAGTEGPSR